MLFTLVLVLGMLWSLKPALTTAERLVALLPCAPFTAAEWVGALIAGWPGVACVLGIKLLCLLSIPVIGGRLRDRRMAEVIAAS